MASSAYNKAFSAHLDKSSILLVGRGGNGKSSCKRSIERVSNTIEVIDFSGLGDTGTDRSDNISTVTNNLKRVIEMTDSKGGFKAIVFAMKYGVRFTKQEKDAVEDVKAMLGEDVFRNHVIILMSYGDLLEMFNAEGEGDFMGWCREQTGDIQSLFSEVNYRIVLFNNREEDPGKQRKQCDELISMVIRMGKSYGLNEFNAAQKRLQKPILCLDTTLSEAKSNNVNSSSKSGLAYKLFWLCLLLEIVFSTAFTISVVKLITWLIVISCLVLFLVTYSIITLKLKNYIQFA